MVRNLDPARPLAFSFSGVLQFWHERRLGLEHRPWWHWSWIDGAVDLLPEAYILCGFDPNYLRREGVRIEVAYLNTIKDKYPHPHEQGYIREDECDPESLVSWYDFQANIQMRALLENRVLCYWPLFGHQFDEAVECAQEEGFTVLNRRIDDQGFD